ncbi:MAG: ABC transporter ATP-binding protein [Hyphomicrobiales bacterium]
MASPLLALDGVHTHIGRYHILQGVDLEVPEGAMTVLLGRNGAGKTTTMRTIMGLWRASKGAIRFCGAAIEKETTPSIARRGIGYVPENMGIFGTLSVRENLVLAAANGPIDRDRLGHVFSLFPPLKTFFELPAGNLSGGQKQMLSIARAMIEKRRLVLIDEPSKGLSPSMVKTMTEALSELKRSGTTILLVEQNFATAEAVGDTVAIMDDGRIVHRGAMAELAADRGLQERLMGLSLGAHQ